MASRRSGLAPCGAGDAAAVVGGASSSPRESSGSVADVGIGRLLPAAAAHDRDSIGRRGANAHAGVGDRLAGEGIVAPAASAGDVGLLAQRARRYGKHVERAGCSADGRAHDCHGQAGHGLIVAARRGTGASLAPRTRRGGPPVGPAPCDSIAT